VFFDTILWHLISSTSSERERCLMLKGLSQSFIQSLFISIFSPFHLRSFHLHVLTSASDLRFDGGARINLRPGPKPEFYICRLHGPDANPKNRILDRPRPSNGDEPLLGYIKDLQWHMGVVSPWRRAASPPDLIRLPTCVDRLGSTGLQTRPMLRNLPVSNFLSLGTRS